MKLGNRRGDPERLLKSPQDSLGALSGSFTRGRILMAGLVAGGVAALTAGSAGISALRRRSEAARNDS
jgi:hypothetical protein